MNQSERGEFVRSLRESNKRKMAEFQRDIADQAMSAPLADPIETWRESMVDFETAREQRERAKERRLNRPRPPAIDERVTALVAAERQYILDVVSNSVGEFVGGEMKAMDGELRRLRREIAELKQRLGAVEGEKVVPLRGAR
jgi:hypothetical protein